MKSLETEIKFYLTKIEPIRNRILETGGKSSGKNFESNIRFEDDNLNLIKNKSLLRLRKDSKTTLTFKSKPIENEKDFKVNRELEVEVSDFYTMNEILTSLGYHREQVYEKWRETFELENTLICIDEMPFGSFIEIEGEKDSIVSVSEKLGFHWEARMICNYLELFELIKSNHDLKFKDVTFDNFQSVDIDFSETIRTFESG